MPIPGRAKHKPSLPRPQGGGVRSSATASPGGSITVNVGTNDPSVEISNDTTGETSTVRVAPGKDTSVTIPEVPGGTILYVRVGKGLRAQIIVVEVITPGP